MSYKVLNTFIEKNHESSLYEKGDVYPHEGFTADPSRVAFLQSKKNKYRIAFLGTEIKEDKKVNTNAADINKSSLQTPNGQPVNNQGTPDTNVQSPPVNNSVQPQPQANAGGTK